jgi:amidophosphoribosyltransferase
MCGIVGIIGPSKQESSVWAAYEAYRGLLTLQHRGQDAAGILSYDEPSHKFYQEKDLGLIAKVFNQKKIQNLKGNMALAHTRYATTGTDGKLDLQPIVTGTPLGVGMVHNGNLVNYHSLKDKIKSELKYQLLTNNDLEVILNYWCHFLLLEGKAFSFSQALIATEKLFKTINGGYSVIGMVAGEGMMAFRDPQGIRPLVLGRRKEVNGFSYCFASETAALNFLGFDYLRDVAPGEFVFVSLDGVLRSALIPRENERVAHCMFEWVYFSGAESIVENESVYKVRLNLGTALAKKAKSLIEQGRIKPDVVMPVPDTSRTAAISVAKELGIDYREGLIKNRYIHRSFILNTQEKREKAIELKLSPIRSEIEGKSILLIDDSVVRGTTSHKIIKLLKKYGAKDVTLGVTCPPLRHGCYYGIDFPSSKELIATDRDIPEIARFIEAKEIIYIDQEDLKSAIGRSDLCMGCIDGDYPTSVEEGIRFATLRQLMKEKRI